MSFQQLSTLPFSVREFALTEKSFISCNINHSWKFKADPNELDNNNYSIIETNSNYFTKTEAICTVTPTLPHISQRQLWHANSYTYFCRCNEQKLLV